MVDSTKTMYIFINAKLGYENNIINDLKEIQEVKAVHGVFGAYDIIAKVEASEEEKLRDLINWKIRKMQNIHSILTLLSYEL